jgi:hypothetical protein
MPYARGRVPCNPPLSSVSPVDTDLGQGVNDNLSSRGLALDSSLRSLVQLLHAKTERNHLLQGIIAAQSTQPAVTTSADAHGVPSVPALSCHVHHFVPTRHST